MPAFTRREHIDVVLAANVRVFLVPIAWQKVMDTIGDSYIADFQIGIPHVAVTWAACTTSKSANIHALETPNGLVFDPALQAAIVSAIELRLDEEITKR